MSDLTNGPDNTQVVEKAVAPEPRIESRSKTTHVLVVDDEAPTLDFLSRRLAGRGYEVSTASSAHAALEVMKIHLPHILLLDISMPGVTGVELLRELRQKHETQTLPIIMVSALDDTENIVTAIRDGANDYVTKPINMPVLVARMETHLRMAALVHHLEAQTQILSKLAAFDELTGLYNRRSMFGALEAALQRMKVHRRPLSVMMMDLDHFKRVNDEHGHAAGDQVLREFARRLTTSVRQTDIRCRYGGEEFCVVLPDTNPENARLFAERIRQSVEQASFPIGNNTAIPITVSIGLTTLHPDRELTPTALLENADQALYDAKEGGRNRVVVFGASE